MALLRGCVIPVDLLQMQWLLLTDRGKSEHSYPTEVNKKYMWGKRVANAARFPFGMEFGLIFINLNESDSNDLTCSRRCSPHHCLPSLGLTACGWTKGFGQGYSSRLKQHLWARCSAKVVLFGCWPTVIEIHC